MAVQFFEEEVKSKLTNKRALSAFLQAQLIGCQPQWKKVSLRYIFCDDAYLLRINQQFLNHDTFTDIITFDLTERPDVLQGEIYVSTERVAENAAALGEAYLTELHRVLFHGALHLCGYKDKTKAEAATMRSMESNWLDAYFKN